MSIVDVKGNLEIFFNVQCVSAGVRPSPGNGA